MINRGVCHEMDRCLSHWLCHIDWWSSRCTLENGCSGIGTAWSLIGVMIAIGIGIMLAVTNSGSKENIEIDRK
jgi:hypothetical protein